MNSSNSPLHVIDANRPKVDLSDLIARIDVACMQLEHLESGHWYDVERSCRRIADPAVASWLRRYGFSGLSELPIDAMFAFAVSLERHLARISPPNTKAPMIKGAN